MNAFISLIAVVALALVAYFAAQAKMFFTFGVIIPYAAIAIFIIGVISTVMKWAGVPVPFRIPSTCGQQKSLDWIPSSRLDNPHTKWGVIGRMLLEVLFFRTLFRNTKSELREGPRLTFGSDKWLWAAALAFHWSFLVIFIRHFKFFVEPVPSFIMAIQSLDSFLQIGVPILFITDILLLIGVTYLFARRVLIPQLKYISLAADFFPLLLILGIAGTGMWMRYFDKVDIEGVKMLGHGLMTGGLFAPGGGHVATDIGPLFYSHLFLVCCLMVYFPFSKLMHMAGVFLSPTRNLANNNRMVRHVNPWNPKVKHHTYAEYEDEFREVMVECGLPVEKPLEEPAKAEDSDKEE